jgi:hypothetical protein
MFQENRAIGPLTVLIFILTGLTTVAFGHEQRGSRDDFYRPNTSGRSPSAFPGLEQWHRRVRSRPRARVWSYPQISPLSGTDRTRYNTTRLTTVAFDRRVWSQTFVRSSGRNSYLRTPNSMILDILESLFRGLHNPHEYLIQSIIDQYSFPIQEPSLLFFNSSSSKTSLTSSSLQMCQHHQVYTTMCKCVSIFQAFYKGHKLAPSGTR